VGRDYRIGLVAGSILVGVILLWVATRPNMGPLPQPTQSNDRNALEAALTVPLPNAGSPPETNRPKPDEVIQAAGQGPTTQDKGQPVVLRDSSSGSPDATSRAKTEPSKTTRFHVVHQGETLSGIAQQYYGSANDWHKILAANENTIKDANKIAPGTKLIIP
jgi:5'-nucleotidase/UDP-sugar diphosphatase